KSKRPQQSSRQLTPHQKYPGEAEQIKPRRENHKERSLERLEKVNKLRQVSSNYLALDVRHKT
ncbi:MAG: hypothetical protein ACOC7Z_02735, partial [Candidatus Bipolaricaulota bacterium]